jgi:GNAT superfamily N-acetyltransferase
MITYRRAEEKDKKDFIEMDKLFYKFDNDIGVNEHLIPISHYEIPEKIFENYFDESLKNVGFFLIACEDNKVIGYIFAEIKDIASPHAYEIKKVGFVDSVFVKEEFRGKGIAKELINKSSEWMKSKGISICTLNVRYKNIKAAELYKTMGFKKDDIVMYKEI